jgi:polyadenylate-binding protein 2
MPAKAKVILKKFVENNDNKNCYILFEKREEAMQALKENGKTLKDRVIRVDMAFNDSKNYDYTIFIGNLPFDVVDKELREHFKQFTGIEYIRIIRDKESHKGKGIAYICFANKTDYKAAVLMNGSMFRDRRLRVKKAVEKKKLEKK